MSCCVAYLGVVSSLSLVSVMYVPTQSQLQELDLQALMWGDNAQNWERLHVTVTLETKKLAKSGCEYGVSLLPVDSDGFPLEIETGQLRELGCATQICAFVDGVKVCDVNENPDSDFEVDTVMGKCHVSIPTALAYSTINSKRFVGLNATWLHSGGSSPGNYTCEITHLDDMTLTVTMEPFTAMYDCEDNFFWSHRDEECKPCQNEDILSLCPPGHFVRGCDALAHVGESYCSPCENTPANFDTGFYAWHPTSECVLECVNNQQYQYFMNGTVCSPCTQSLRTCSEDPGNNCCAKTPGKMWQACTSSQNEQCVDCPEILKLQYSQNEVHIPWTSDCESYFIQSFYTLPKEPPYCECQTTCIDNHYRSLTIPNVPCVPCSTGQELLLTAEASAEAGETYKFQQCTKASNTQILQCERKELGCDGIPYSGKVFDLCDVCGGDNSTCIGCDGVVNSGKEYDECDICDGDSTTCQGCDGVPNSGLVVDVCNQCGGDNTSCWGCDNISNSGLVFDACGECGGDGSSCWGCDNVSNSGLVFDACGECGGNNATCTGCDGVLFSGKRFDVCGVCDGFNQSADTCGQCYNDSSILSQPIIALDDVSLRSDKLEYVRFGPRVWNIQKNGGFTIVTKFKLKDNVGRRLTILKEHWGYDCTAHPDGYLYQDPLYRPGVENPPGSYLSYLGTAFRATIFEAQMNQMNVHFGHTGPDSIFVYVEDNSTGVFRYCGGEGYSVYAWDESMVIPKIWFNLVVKYDTTNNNLIVELDATDQGLADYIKFRQWTYYDTMSAYQKFIIPCDIALDGLNTETTIGNGVAQKKWYPLDAEIAGLYVWDHFMTDEASKQMLQNINIHNFTVSSEMTTNNDQMPMQIPALSRVAHVCNAVFPKDLINQNYDGYDLWGWTDQAIEQFTYQSTCGVSKPPKYLLGQGTDFDYLWGPGNCTIMNYTDSDVQQFGLISRNLSGRALRLDVCGVCDGDNSSCWGCDNVSNSNLVMDFCGVCDGDNSTCITCDGKLHPAYVDCFIEVNLARYCGETKDQPCPVSASSWLSYAPPHLATNGIWEDNSNNPMSDMMSGGWKSDRESVETYFFKIDFGQIRTVDYIKMYPWVTYSTLYSLGNTEYRVGNSNNHRSNDVCAFIPEHSSTYPTNIPKTLTCNATGRYLFVTRPAALTSWDLVRMEFSEIEPYGTVMSQCKNEEEIKRNDDCGVCGGSNEEKDSCGVCYGDNSTCAGCDGVVNSGISYDECNVCGGDNTTCECDIGYTGPQYGKLSDSCVLCGPGTYKDVIGSAACTECGFNTYNPEYGSTSSSACLPCMEHSETEEIYGHESIHACMCISGYYHDTVTSCKACTPGTFNVEKNRTQCSTCNAGSYVGSSASTTCQLCGSNTYSHEGSALCTNCPGNTESPAGSTVVADCICKEGYTGPNGGHCQACLAGTYKSGTGSGACIACDSGTYSTSSAATTCLTCQTCASGQYLSSCGGTSTGTCVDCLTEAAKCTGNTYLINCGASYSGACSPCASCLAGEQRNGCTGVSVGLCEACPSGMFKPSTGTEQCQTCPTCSAGKYNTGTCDGINSNTCVDCVAGKYSNVAGLSACLDCQAGKISGAAAATICTTCTEGSTPSADNTTCNGCDNVANSGLVFDSCLECGGNNSTCIGCDGVMWDPLGCKTGKVSVNVARYCGSANDQACAVSASSTRRKDYSYNDVGDRYIPEKAVDGVKRGEPTYVHVQDEETAQLYGVDVWPDFIYVHGTYWWSSDVCDYNNGGTFSSCVASYPTNCEDTYFKLDLGQQYNITRVELFNGDIPDEMHNLDVRVGDNGDDHTANSICAVISYCGGSIVCKDHLVLDCNAFGQYVYLTKQSGCIKHKNMGIVELEVYGLVPYDCAAKQLDACGICDGDGSSCSV